MMAFTNSPYVCVFVSTGCDEDDDGVCPDQPDSVPDGPTHTTDRGADEGKHIFGILEIVDYS
jgi:hypothetical protein